MNRLALLMTIVSISILFSCKKDDEIIVQTPNTVVGEWNWVKSIGGFTGTDLYTPSNTKTVKKLLFKDNGAFVRIENGDTLQKTTYFTSREKSLLFHDTLDFVTLNNGSGIRYIIESMDDSLKIQEDVFDGFSHEYVRIFDNYR